MTQTRLEEKLGFVMADTKILILLKDKKYDEVKIYIKQLLNHLPTKDACHEIACMIDAACDQEKLLECIDFNDQKNLLFGAMKKFNPTLIDFLLQKKFVLQISDKYFTKLLIFSLLQKQLFHKAKCLIEWRSELGDCDIKALLHAVLRYIFQHQITIEKAALQLLCVNGADPMEKYNGKLLLQDAIEMDNVLAVEFFLQDEFLNQYSKEELILIFEILVREGWIADAEILLTRKQTAIMSLMPALELDAIFCAVANETYHLPLETEQKENENFLKLLLKLGANPARILPVEGVQTNAFYLMQPAWDWMFSMPYVSYFTEENLLSVLMICANSSHPKRNDLIKNALLHKENILNDKKNLDYILFKLCKDQIMDNELYEHLIYLGANPFANFGSHNVFDIVWSAKQEYKIECILEKYIQDLTPVMLASIYSAALKNHWHAIQDILASGKNIKKTLMLEKLQAEQTKKFIADVLRDDKPDQDFIHFVIRHPNTEISFDESVLDYAKPHNEMIKEILASSHNKPLPFAQGYHAMQCLFSDEEFEVRFANFELLKYFNQMSAENYLKRKGLTGILHHEIHKTKKMTEVMQIVKFIETHKKNYPFMRDTFFCNDWKMLRQAAMARIHKIASDHQVIVFSDALESEEVRSFMNTDTECYFWQHKKNSYDQLVKDKIQILANESLSKRIFPQ